MGREEQRQVARLGRRLGRWAVGTGGLGTHVGAFLVGTASLILLNLATDPADLWFWRPIAVWFVLLIVHIALVVVGLVGDADASAEVPVGPATAPAPARPVPDRSASRVAAATRPIVRAAGSAAQGATRSATSLAEAARRGIEGVAQRRREQRTTDEAVAAWAQATDGWPEPPPFDDAGQTSTWTVPPRPSGQAGAVNHRDIDPAGVVRADPVDPPLPATPNATGRFWGAPTSAPSDAGRGTNGRAAPHGAETARTPAAIEALWRSSPRRRDASPSAWVPATPAPPLPRAVSNDAPPPPRRTADRGEDVVLRGPFPVDAKDPHWARLESEAAAWLARREADAKLAAGPRLADDERGDSVAEG